MAGGEEEEEEAGGGIVIKTEGDERRSLICLSVCFCTLNWR